MIELSNGEEAHPFTWLSVCHTKNEDCTKAREGASKVAELDPFSSTDIMRLSEALAREKQYVQAHLYFERAHQDGERETSFLTRAHQSFHSCAFNLARGYFRTESRVPHIHLAGWLRSTRLQTPKTRRQTDDSCVGGFSRHAGNSHSAEVPRTRLRLFRRHCRSRRMALPSANLTKLVLRAVYTWPHPIESVEDEKPDLRASIRVLNLLCNSPDLLPNLRDLELVGCYVPAGDLLQYVKRRKHTAGCIWIEPPVLVGCS